MRLSNSMTIKLYHSKFVFINIETLPNRSNHLSSALTPRPDRGMPLDSREALCAGERATLSLSHSLILSRTATILIEVLARPCRITAIYGKSSRISVSVRKHSNSGLSPVKRSPRVLWHKTLTHSGLKKQQSFW